MKKILLPLSLKSIVLLFLFFANHLSAQTLPEIDIKVVSKNYFEICRQLDAYFATEYVEETDCPDNAFVKYQRWKWWWRDRVQSDGSFPNLRAQWLEYQKHFVAAAQNRDGQPMWTNTPVARPDTAPEPFQPARPAQTVRQRCSDKGYADRSGKLHP